MKKVAVVAGGTSSEREISLLSGQGAFNALKAKGYPVVLIDLKEDLVAFIRELKSQNPDVIFNALHGRYGEDGNIQGVFNLMHIPYTHSGCLASALAMDKKMTKRLLKDAGIPMAADKMVTLEDIRKGDTLPFPYVVKPNNEGSSVGVSIIENKTDEDYLINSWPFGETKVLMEEYIKGREMSVPVLGDQAIGIVEIAPKTGFYTYENKYTEGKTDHIIPAPLPAEQTQLLKTYALKAHQILGCRGASRSDFRYDDTDPEHPKIAFLEINTQPGMTPLSLLPEVAKKAGISYEDIVSYLVEDAACEE